ncbi:MAG: hypothetical protein ACTSQE_06090 [Candidatus Heimdallarchaeaceae archaeon]
MEESNPVNDLLKSIEKYGLSKSNIVLLEQFKEHFSIEQLTEIIAENINIYTDFFTLLDFLPHIWVEGNSSPHLLLYIAGILHRLLYFVREYLVVKEVPEFLKEDIETIHAKLCTFRDSCIEGSIIMTFKEPTVQSFDQLIDVIKNYPRMPPKLYESLQIMGSFFFNFVSFPEQKINNVDELALYISRSIILWKFGTITDEQLHYILKKAVEIFVGNIELDNFSKILSFEFQNYQFIQIGIDHLLVNLIAKVIYNEINKN